jgi:hypothetical protein
MNLATQTKNFLSSFRLSAEGWGEEPDKEMQGSFWVCPRESASAVEARSSAIGAYEKISSHHARGACEVSQGFCKSRFWRSTIETPVSKSENPRRQKYAPRGARRRGKWANRAQKGQATASEEKMVGYLEELEGNYAKRDAAYARGCKKDPKTCIPRSSVTIIGKVTDTTGAAVDGATISSLGSQSSTKTSTDGAYSITVDVRPPQKVRLRAIKQDYSDGIGTLFVTDAARKTFSGPDIQIAKAEGVITLDTAKRVVVQGTAHTTDSDFIVSGKQSTYTIPFNAIVAPDGQPYRGKVNVYVYEFNEQSVPRNLTNVDTFDDARGYAGNQMKSFGMPYIQFMSDTGKELHVLKSNPMTLSYRIANMKELRNNSAKIYEAVTDADMVKLVQASKLPGYPIDRQYLIDNNMLRFPAFWVFDRTRGVWDNVGVKVMDTDGLIESPFYTISSINK